GQQRLSERVIRLRRNGAGRSGGGPSFYPAVIEGRSKAILGKKREQGGLGGDGEDAVRPAVAQHLAGVAEQLPGVPPAPGLRPGGQGVDVAALYAPAVRKGEGYLRQGQHGLDLPVFRKDQRAGQAGEGIKVPLQRGVILKDPGPERLRLGQFLRTGLVHL